MRELVIAAMAGACVAAGGWLWWRSSSGGRSRAFSSIFRAVSLRSSEGQAEEEKSSKRGGGGKIGRASAEVAKQAKQDKHLSYTTEQRDSWRAAREAQKLVTAGRLEQAINGGADLEIAVDMSYGPDVQTKAYARSISKQLCHVYNNIKDTRVCTLLHLTTYAGEKREALVARGSKGWNIKKHEQDLTEVFSHRLEDLVFLSPDSEHVLTCLEKGRVYVIGGIVDKPVVKNVSWKRANAAGFRSARLPVKEFVPRELQGKGHVLNINTTAHVLIKFAECGDWLRAFKAAMVKERQAVNVDVSKDVEMSERKRVKVAQWAKGDPSE